MTPELMNRLKACETAEDLCAIAGELGMDLTEEQLTAAAGAFCCADKYAPLPMGRKDLPGLPAPAGRGMAESS